MLKPIYKWYQLHMFSVYGAHFKWEAIHRSDCVNTLLDAARTCYRYSDDVVARFRKAVLKECTGDQGDLTPR